ncbi:MAG: hypothetical protein QCI38_04000 [Candidatus Thermoplasmatota archaeon]|nr:hypothetical protein [Candidatus Thermoplasmatota archaeon]
MSEEEIPMAKTARGSGILRKGPIIALLFFLWIFMLHLSPSFYYAFPMGIDLATWRLAGMGVFVVIIAAEAYTLTKASGSSQEMEDEESPKTKKKVLEYPPKITGVIYADTYIPINEGVDLKMRTMLARACALCEKEEECWEKSGAGLDKKDFEANMECKEGLRELGVPI